MSSIRLRPAFCPQPGGERIVTAGVEDHEAQPPRLPELAQEQVERQRLVGQVALALELGIGRDQEVLARDLDAVAGEVDQRQIALLGLAAELAQGCAELAGVGIQHEVGLEAEPAQRLGHRLGIAGRIVQLGRVLVGADADDESETSLVLSLGCTPRQDARQPEQDSSAQDGQRMLSPPSPSICTLVQDMLIVAEPHWGSQG